MSYSAVVTTGIYCRPGCSARPDRRNVRIFELAAAAEAAGYRACLRCRPYRTEQPLGAIGPELVCRAVRLIVDGALDGRPETELAARLGVSPRHLRRLFMEHVGVTPDQLARSRRTHFARRLLDDTDLTITDIAFASGFGSARQMNRAFLQVFKATPRELRARRRISDRLVADGGLELRLPFTGPLNWEQMISYAGDRTIKGTESVSDGSYRRTIDIDGSPGVVELAKGADDHVLMRAHLPRWEGLIHLVVRARRILNLDNDVTAAEKELRDDPAIGPLVAGRPGLRPLGTWDSFEIGVRAIIGQQVSVAGAGTIAARLVERHGTPVEGLSSMGLSHLFPSPHALSSANLDGLGLVGSRIEAIKAFARAVDAGAIPLDRSAGLDELVASLVALPGIGEWTAHYLALRLGEPDAFPASDLGLRRAMGEASGIGVPSASELGRLAERWRPYRAVAAVHLWASLSPTQPTEILSTSVI